MKNAYSVLFLLIIIFVFSIPAFAKKVVTLEEVNRPFGFYVDKDRFYITEGVTVYIYSLDNYRLLTKFGKEGEGPGEVLLRRRSGNDQVTLTILTDYLVVNSATKILYFSKDGKYIKEIRIAKAGRWLTPFGSMFIGKKYIHEPDGLYHAVVLYDSNLEKIKDIYKHIHGFQGWRRPFNPLTVEQADFEIEGDKIFVLNSARSMVRVYDRSGKELFSLTNSDEIVEFTKEDKKDMIEGLKRHPFWKRIYETRKHLFEFPAYYPPIRGLLLDRIEKKIYLKTHKIENEQRKWLAFDSRGKFLKKMLLPFGWYRISNGKAYRLLENEEDETWELYVFKIPKQD
jgi:hypothetical protein